MDTEQISRYVDDLIKRVNYVGAENFQIDKEIEEYQDQITREGIPTEIKDAVKEKLLDRINYRESHDGAVLIPISVVDDPKEHEEWYEEWITKHDNIQDQYYWKRLENFLEKALTDKYGSTNAGRIVKSIDEATFGIMENMANPRRKEFSYKGLVLGYVQSGKTANFTALIAKAADAGYKFIVVLAGIHNILRLQTQIRLDKELTGINDRKLDEKFISTPSDIKQWNRLTSATIEDKDKGEFRRGSSTLPFSVYCEKSNPTLAVIKKNCRVLDRLIDYVKEAGSDSLEKMPLLIIDDEADQASVDGNATDPDSDPTATNFRIRKLMSLFTRKAYVGYTATPFANVLIDMTSEDEQIEDDLYPRNFIVSLPEPKGYFGASRIFEGDLSDEFVKVVPDEKENLILGRMTENLAHAIDDFLFSCAVRNLRGQRNKPMSMLIHVSHKIDDMSTVKLLVETYFSDVRDRYSDIVGKEKLKKEYGQSWVEFGRHSKKINNELQTKNELPDFEEVWSELSSVFDKISILELNSSTEDRLDYSSGEEIKVIAVGGNQLSRGLTLEGLMTSYYLRRSRQYDTLLQMARWFGYRSGYEDLTRVHTTAEIWELFEHLALVEEEIRSEIYRYEEEDKTPEELAIVIRDHSTLNVTAPNKMGAATVRQASFSKSLNQTIWLPLDEPDKLKANFELGENFINSINNSYKFEEPQKGIYLAKNIPGREVLQEFLNKYQFVDKQKTGGPGLDAERLIGYVYRRINDVDKPELLKWNIAVVGNRTAVKGCSSLNYGGLEINRIQRSRKHREKGFNIGVLTEPEHLRIDLGTGANDPYDGRSPQNPLLLLYLIWSDSKARNNPASPQYGERINLFRFIDSAKIDPLGLAIVLPESKADPYDFIGQ